MSTYKTLLDEREQFTNYCRISIFEANNFGSEIDKVAWENRLQGFEYGLKVGAWNYHLKNILTDCLMFFDRLADVVCVNVEQFLPKLDTINPWYTSRER